MITVAIYDPNLSGPMLFKVADLTELDAILDRCGQWQDLGEGAFILAQPSGHAWSGDVDLSGEWPDPDYSFEYSLDSILWEMH